MKNQTKIKILNLAPVFTLKELTECAPMEVLRKYERSRPAFPHSSPNAYYFAQGRTGACVFLNTVDSPTEMLDLARQSISIFDPAKLKFITQGLPLLMSENINPVHDLQLRFTFEP